MTHTMTSQNIDLSSWDSMYSDHWAMKVFSCVFRLHKTCAPMWSTSLDVVLHLVLNLTKKNSNLDLTKRNH